MRQKRKITTRKRVPKEITIRPDQRYFRVAEAAAYTGTDPWFIAQKIRDHKKDPTVGLPFTLAGKHHILDRVDLDKLMQDLKAQTEKGKNGKA
jgi:hypothetical protein